MKSLRRILFGFHGAPGQVGCIQHPTLSRHRRAPLLAKCWLTAMVVVAFDAPPGKSAEASLSAAPYLHAARQFADRVVTDGRDSYGNQKTPLFVDGLHAETLEPVRWKKDGETWVLSNFASQQPLIRLLDGLTALTGNPSYRQAADAAARYVLEHLRTPNGLLHWGGHSAWDLQEDKAVAHSPFLHEMKGQQPHYRLMHRLDPAATTKLMEMIWAAHILDWPRLDYNRHANALRNHELSPVNEYQPNIEVPFLTKAANLSFVNVTPSLMHSGVERAILNQDVEALTWTKRLIHRWQQARHSKTGLSGGQLSFRERDRAHEALGHVHPEINEAKIVATYHQRGRYHALPLAQLQAAEALLAAGGAGAEVGREFLEWASEDLKTYARRCYDPKTGMFPAVMTDGKPIEWQKARAGYYNAESFAPGVPDGYLFWGYCLAYRLTRSSEHWQMVRELSRRLGLGDPGEADASGQRLDSGSRETDWRLIYALLELHQATRRADLLRMACLVGDNAVAQQVRSGLFPRPGRDYARTGDEIPLALLHLAAAITGERDALPRAISDRRYFHCKHDGPLEPHQIKRDDPRTYDHLVYYGEP